MPIYKQQAAVQVHKVQAQYGLLKTLLQAVQQKEENDYFHFPLLNPDTFAPDPTHTGIIPLT